MKKILFFTTIFLTMATAYQYTIFDMNGKNQGTINGELNKSILSDFAKKNHGSILVKKGSKNIVSSLQDLISKQQYNALTNLPKRDINLNVDSLDKEHWLEVEKNEIISICFDKRVLTWETSLTSKILNDSCLAFKVPTLIGVDSLKVNFLKDYDSYNLNYLNSNSTYNINLAIGMKFLDFINEEVLLGSNELGRTRAPLEGVKEEDPEKLVSITNTYLVDKYPVTNCEFTQLMWDSIPKESSYAHTGAKRTQEAWFARKKNSIRNENCIAKDSAASTVFLYQAMKYANARSIRENLKPYYIFSTTTDDESKILSKGEYIIGYYSFTPQENSSIHVSVDTTSNGYRLPYYNEWMIFARGGDKQNRAPWGNSSASIENVLKYANFGTATKHYDSDPVGQLQPNGYGLYDMFGLVWEHVLFEKNNPFLLLQWKPSCLKGGDKHIRLDNEDRASYVHRSWQKIDYGHSKINYSGFVLSGFRLVRKLK